MRKQVFWWVVAGIIFVGLGFSAKRDQEAIAQQAKGQEATKNNQEVQQQVDAIKRERDAWCAANGDAIKQILHHGVVKIEDGYMREVPLPLTTVTISYAIWKELNKGERRKLEDAVRCHSKHRYGGPMRYVDLNGVVIDGIK